MMPFKVESGKNISENRLGSGRFLRDIEEISNALYLHKNPPKDLVSLSVDQFKSSDNARVAESKLDEDFLYKNKKSSIWKWKPLKALNRFRNHRFNCCFFLRVHAIHGLPPSFNDLRLCVNWKRKDEVLRTRPAQICQGTANFEETLMHRCSVYGNRNGHQNSAKYEPKLFLLNASVTGVPALDLGKHWIDLTRLLPLTLEELEDEKKTSGKWTTSFKLSGKAKGATLDVSFSFSVLWDNSIGPSCFVRFPDNLKGNRQSASDQFNHSGRVSTSAMLSRLSSVPGNSGAQSHRSMSIDITRIDKILSEKKLELARSGSFLYRKREEEKLGNSDEFSFDHGHLKPVTSKCLDVPRLAGESSAYDDSEFTMNGHGMELSLKEELKREEDDANPCSNYCMVETIDVAEVFKDIETTQDERVVDGNKHEENDIFFERSSVEELESVLHNFLSSESDVLDSLLDTGKFVRQESFVNRSSSFKEGKMVRSRSLDDLTESIANDFLKMLDIEQYPQDVDSDGVLVSPRERLLQQFLEEESSVSGNSVFNFHTTEKENIDFSGLVATGRGKMACYDDFDLQQGFQEEAEEQRRATQSLRSKRNLKVLENLETEALMKKWGLDDTDFRNSPRISSGGFGSPVHVLPEKPPELPPLGEGFNPVERTKDGGSLRSMNPLLFKNAKNGAQLVVQVSRSVVLPSAVGSSVMDIFEFWASEGVEKMHRQTNELMPLDDITGKTMEQISWEYKCGSEVLQRHEFLGMQEKDGNFYSSWTYSEIDSGHVSAKDLFPLAMAKIEALTVEGLKIQSNMSEKEASSSIRPRSIANLLSPQNEFFSSEGDVKSQLLDVGDVDAIIKLSLSLNEWLKLDAGDFIVEDENNEQILKILAAHQAKSINLSSGDEVKLSGKRVGILGNRFTLALRLQLRDPFRNYEMVGTSMIALILVERIHICMQEEEEEEEEEEEIGNHTSLFKIIEIHISGMNVEASNKKTWINKRQQQSGIRWLLSSGMGMNNKRRVSNSKAMIISSTPANIKAHPDDILWSISSDSEISVAHHPYIRNPNIVFPEKSISI